MAGVYQIRCLPTGKVYVGSTAMRFCQRFARHKHRLRKGYHHSIHLQRAWNKHGETAFVFEPLFVVSEALVEFYEQRTLDVLKPELNIARVVRSSRGIKRRPVTNAYRESSRQRVLALPDRGATALIQACRTPEFRARQAARVKARHAAGGYAAAHAARSDRQSHRHLIHGQMLTLKQAAQIHGFTAKALRRRVERGCVGDQIVAERYARV